MATFEWWFIFCSQCLPNFLFRISKIIIIIIIIIPLKTEILLTVKLIHYIWNFEVCIFCKFWDSYINARAVLHCVIVWPNSSPNCYGRTAAHITDKSSLITLGRIVRAVWEMRCGQSTITPPPPQFSRNSSVHHKPELSLFECDLLSD